MQTAACITEQDNLYIGTWNVMTLLKPGKMQELMDEIVKTQIEILALQEVRWPGKGQINKKRLLILLTGFLLMKKIQKHLINFELHNERLCKLRINGKFNSITLINAYTPTEDKTGDKGTVP